MRFTTPASWAGNVFEPPMQLCVFLTICISSVEFGALAVRDENHGLQGSWAGVERHAPGRNSLNITEWVCAFRRNCNDPMVASFMSDHDGRACNPKTDILNDDNACAQLLPMTAEEDAGGQSMITYDAVKASCENVLGHWWSLLIGQEEIHKDDLVKKLDRELRHQPLVEWLLLQQENMVSSRKFLDYVVKGCVQVSLNVFTGGKFTMPAGAGALTEVFGRISLAEKPSRNIIATTYGAYFTGIEEATEKFSKFTALQVGKNWVKEHPRFQELRKSYAVDDNFLTDVNKEVDDVGGSGSVFIPHGKYLLKCETEEDWHSAVDWRAFHVRADEYFDYMRDNPESLLPRIFTAYYDESFQGIDNSAFCFVIQNWIPESWNRKSGNWYAKRRGSALAFDFKGSVIYSKRGDTNNRLVRNWDREHIPGTQGVMKDLNFLSTMDISLPCDTRRLLLEQVAKDVEWLKQGMIMDYSFFLHVITVGAMDPETLKAVCPLDGTDGTTEDDKLQKAFFQRDRGFLAVVPAWSREMHVYSMGLIDTLQPYSLFKAIGTAYDRVLFPEQVDAFAMNNIPADEYATRFVAFLDHTTICALEPGEYGEAQERLLVRHASSNCRKFKLEQSQKMLEEKKIQDFCEDVLSQEDESLPEAYKALSTEFTADEVHQVRKDANFMDASCYQRELVAVYMIAPHSVHHVLHMIGQDDFGMHSLSAKEDMSTLNRLYDEDAVIINSDMWWRLRKNDLQELGNVANEDGCIFRSYAETYQPMVQKQLDSLFNETINNASCKRDLVIKEDCEPFGRCAEQMRLLKSSGYKVHVIGAVEPYMAALQSSHWKSSSKDAFAKVLASITPMMAMATGRCDLVDTSENMNWEPPQKLRFRLMFSETCPGMDEYEPYTLPEAFALLDQELLAIGDIETAVFRQAQEAQGVRDVDIMIQHLCQHANIRGDPFCVDGPSSIHLMSLGTQSKGGSSLFRGHKKLTLPRFSFIIKSMHRHELDTWRTHFSAETEISDRYLAPFLAVWQDFGINWALMPDCLDTYQEGTTYDIKGVPTLRYFRYSGILRDPNWIADFSDKASGRSQIGIALGHYLNLVEKLGMDLSKLESAAAVDYSLLVSVFEDVVKTPPRHLGITSMQKNVLPAYDFRKGGSLIGFLPGGLIDYLENTTSLRKDRPEVQEDMSVTLHSSPGVYACRLMLFVATQMLAPCRWETEEACSVSGAFAGAEDANVAGRICRRPDVCVNNFDKLYFYLFGPMRAVLPRNREMIGCANWPNNHKSIMEAVPFIKNYVETYINRHTWDGVKLNYNLKLCELPKQGKVPPHLYAVPLDNMTLAQQNERKEHIAKMREDTQRDFNDTEKAAAREESGFGRMLCDQKEPLAIFILGPPSAGKSSVGAKQLQDLGMPLDEKKEPRAVTMDGDIWRDHHAGYQRLVQWGMRQQEPCMFMDAADGLKAFTKPQKRSIFNDAVEKKCNIIIPETCSSVDRCAEMVLKLKAVGYKVHVFAVMAEKAKVFERGWSRQDRTGRFYNTETFDKCVTAVLPIMALANGTCQLIDNSADRRQEGMPKGAGPQTRMLSECRNMDSFTNSDWKNAQLQTNLGLLHAGKIDLQELRLSIMDIAGVSEDRFKADEKRQMKLLAKVMPKSSKS